MKIRLNERNKFIMNLIVLCLGMMMFSQNAKCNQNSPNLKASQLIMQEEEYKILVEKTALSVKDKITKTLRLIAPEGLQSHSPSKLKIKLSQTGEVLEVETVKSSGYRHTDFTIESAVRISSPLPLPNIESIANKFREFVITINV